MRNTGFPKVDNWNGWVVGADEVGWGAMAGPLVVAAAAAPLDWRDPRITDSKALTPVKREALYREYTARRREFHLSVMVVSAHSIDEMTPSKARQEAFRRALGRTVGLCPSPPLVVVDGNIAVSVEGAAECVAYPKADLKVPEVGLASIIAKVARDTMMEKLHETYPQYGWARNKGYVTKDHKAKLDELGPCPEHRRSYGPVAAAEKARANPPWMDDV